MRIKKAFAKEFSPREIKLERTKSGRVTGWIISDSFSGQSEIERMQRVLKILNAYLDPKDRDRVSVIWPITRLERKVLLEDEE
jgi:stress-induced morphogen